MDDIYELMQRINRDTYDAINLYIWDKYGEELNYNNYIDFEGPIRYVLRTIKIQQLISKTKKGSVD